MIWLKIGTLKEWVSEPMADKLQHVDFYQLASDETGALAAQLSEKAAAIAKKVVIHAPKEACQNISRDLWTLRDLSFLAHGIDGDDGAEFADIWISSDGDKNQIEAEFAILMAGQGVRDMTAYERCFIIFNGKDEEELAHARGQWKALSADFKGRCRYFAKNDEGKWEQKAQG